MLVGYAAGQAVKDLFGAKLDLPIMIVRQQLARDPPVCGRFSVWGLGNERLLNKNREDVNAVWIRELLVIIQDFRFATQPIKICHWETGACYRTD
jgi:hypothetical protein